MDGKESAGGGIGLLGAVFVAFLVLKLVGVIDWSWWWVTSPLWIPLAVMLIIFIALFIAFVISSKRREKRLKKRINQFNKKNS
jgi:Flp pilus assembly protein TadB